MPNYLLVEIQNQCLITRQCIVRRKQCYWQSPQVFTCSVDLTFPTNLKENILTQWDQAWRCAYKNAVMQVAVALPQSYLWESQFSHPDQLTPQQCFTYVEYHMQQVMQEQNMVLAWDYMPVANQPLAVLAIAQPVLQFFQQLCHRHRCQLILLTSEQYAIQAWGQQQKASECVIGQLSTTRLNLFYRTQSIIKHQQSVDIDHPELVANVIEQFNNYTKPKQAQWWISGEASLIKRWIVRWRKQISGGDITAMINPPQSFISQGLLIGLRNYD
ncbi:MAG: hypothetical protein GKR77_04305 [Legionellales bacterium]|nr:hypothetical protein [Legionellales bacterium]